MVAKLPKGYEWLYQETGPVMLRKALELYGTVEFPGAADNPIILDWADECGLKNAYSDDAIPWCGLFVAICAKRAGWGLPDSPLWARDWLTWGTPSPVPMLDDVMVFSRGSGGHVAQYVGEDKGYWHIIGGNQSDAVTIMRKPKRPANVDGGLLGSRRAPWKIKQPANVRRVMLSTSGAPIGGSEA